MHAARLVLIALAAALPLVSHAADRTALPSKLFTVVNASFASIASLEVADAGSGAWVDVPLGEPLQGGLATATLRLPEGGCLRRFRVTFRDGRSSTVERVDTCRFHRLRLDAL